MSDLRNQLRDELHKVLAGLPEGHTGMQRRVRRRDRNRRIVAAIIALGMSFGLGLGLWVLGSSSGPPAAVQPTSASSAATSSPSPTPNGSVSVTRRLPVKGTVAAAFGPRGLYVVQVEYPGYRVSLVDPSDGRVRQSVVVKGHGTATDITVAFDSVWVTSRVLAAGVQDTNAGLDRLDALTLTVVAHIDIPGGSADRVEATDDRVWVLETKLFAVDPVPNAIVGSVELPNDREPDSFATTSASLFIAVSGNEDGSEQLIVADGRTGDIQTTTSFRSSDYGIQVSFISLVPLSEEGAVMLGLRPVNTGDDGVLLVIRDGQVVSQAPALDPTFLAPNPEGGAWVASKAAGELESVGPDGAAQTAPKKLEEISGLVSRGQESYVLMLSEIAVAEFSPE
jgi:hypothetical protein